MNNSIEIERDGAWLCVWLNRPQTRNAMSADMIEELIVVLKDADCDATIRGVTLRGRDGVFCAGGDLKQFRSTLQGNATRDDAVASSLRAGELFRDVASLSKPVIAVVEGAAVAGGLGLACAADIVVVTRDARFALTETALGIAPAQIAPHVVRRIGVARAKRIMLTAARFRGTEATDLGIADIVVDSADEIDATEARLRNEVLRCAPNANAVTKALINDIAALEPAAVTTRAANDFADCLLGEEGREGIAAFVQKRKPAWAVEGNEL